MTYDTTTNNVHVDTTTLDLCTADFTPDDEDCRHTPRSRVAAFCLALLVLSYHSENSFAQSVVTGYAWDGRLSIHWEYDLEHGTGELSIWQWGVQVGDGTLYFAGLLPEDAENIQVYNAQMSDQLCSGSVAPAMYHTLTVVPHTRITFDIPSPSNVAAATQRLDFGAACAAPSQQHCVSAVPLACVITPLGSLDDFVTIRPIEQGCNTPADFDCDGDVDLMDFARFQQLFTGDTPFSPK